METFTEARVFVHHSQFQEQRRELLLKLDFAGIDMPIIDVIQRFSKLQHCFTLQSCFGHFLFPGNIDPQNTKTIPRSKSIGSIEYRIAYLAFCLENSTQGKKLSRHLMELTSIDQQYIHYGSADWFWERYPNSYVLQVEPARFKYQDKCILGYEEALHVERIRNLFFDQVRILLEERLGCGPGDPKQTG